MKKMKNIILAIVILALYLLIYSTLGTAFNKLSFTKNNLYLMQVIVYAIMTVLLLITLKVINKTHILKFDGKKFLKGFLVAGFMVFFIVVVFFEEFNFGLDKFDHFQPISQIILCSISIIIGTGFTEEVLCRGIIQNLMYDTFGKKTKKGIYLSIIFTSVLFGLAHFANYFNTTAKFEGVLTQVIVATLIGLYLGAIYARCGSIWALALLHGLFDFVQMVGEAFWGSSTIVQTIDGYHLTQVIAPFFLYTFLFLFLLRKKKIKECYEN